MFQRFILCLFTLSLPFALAAEKRKKGDVFYTQIDNLHPTQFSAGYLEVERKTEKIKELTPKQLRQYVEKKTIPVVLGPGGVLYMIDHHHTALAFLKAGFKNARVEIIKDYSDKGDSFWRTMRENNLVYLFDEEIKRRSPKDLPSQVRDLVDNPYRSLAGRINKNDDYEKSGEPYEEFAWANYFQKKELLKEYLAEKNPAKKEKLFEEAVVKARQKRKDLGKNKCSKVLNQFFKDIAHK